ncbi:hypothetical protein WR25_26823 isoform B [Diploscapter pachys]|uniref:Uncharacterized protein n=1 Tax=Diploscapter pachys TaxID=2018661 RepID=A0A2A2KKQ2_9BILA|nr:hypothetical protein WR25_26823 isoform B [Diploscapter pachys]
MLGEKTNGSGGLKSTLVMRYWHLSEEELRRFNDWKTKFESTNQTLREKLEELSNREENTTLSEQEQRIIEEAYFQHDACMIPFMSNDLSAIAHTNYWEQFRKLAARIDEITQPFDYEGNNNNVEISKLFGAIWQSVVTSEKIVEDVSKVANEAAAISTDGVDYGVEGMINRITTFVNEKGDEQLGDKAKEFLAKMKEVGEKKEQDLLIAFKYINGLSKIVLQHCVNENDREGIKLGLTGFTFFLRGFKHGERFEFTAIRQAINDENALELFSDPRIYLHFERVWIFIQYAAIYGFRLELHSFSVFTKALETIQQNASSNQDITVRCLAALRELLDLDTSNMLGDEPPPSDKDKMRLSPRELIGLVGVFEKAVEKKYESLRKEESLTMDQVQEKYQELLKFPPEFFNETDIAQQRKMNFDDLDAAQSHYFAVVLLHQMYKATAFHFADQIISNYLIFKIKPSDSIDCVKAKISLWSKVIELSRESEALFSKILKESDVKAWILQALHDTTSEIYELALKLANSLLYVEGIHFDHRKKLAKEVAEQEYGRQQINTLDQVKLREYRQQLLEIYGEFGLHLVENGQVPKVIDAFIVKRFQSAEKSTEYVWHLERLLFYGKDEDDQNKCLKVYIKKRHDIIRVIAELYRTLFKAGEEERRECRNLMIATSSLLNQMLDFFYHYGGEKFYESSEENRADLAETSSWKNMMAILAVLSRDIIFENANADDDTAKHRKRVALSLLYNVGLSSGITNAEIIANIRESSRVAGMEDLDEGDRKDMLTSAKKFAKLKINQIDTNLRRCAYVYAKYAKPLLQGFDRNTALNIRESYATDLAKIKNVFEKILKEVVADQKTEEEIKSWADAEEARQKRFEKSTQPNKKTGTVLNEGTPQSANQSASGVSGYRTQANILTVPIGHPSFENIMALAKNAKVEIGKKLIEGYAKDKEGKETLHLLIQKEEIMTNLEEIGIFLEFFEHPDLIDLTEYGFREIQMKRNIQPSVSGENNLQSAGNSAKEDDEASEKMNRKYEPESKQHIPTTTSTATTEDVPSVSAPTGNAASSSTNHNEIPPVDEPCSSRSHIDSPSPPQHQEEQLRSIKPNIANEPQPDVAAPPPLAVDGIFMRCRGHQLLDEIRVTITNYKEAICQQLVEKYGKGISYALMLCLENSHNKDFFKSNGYKQLMAMLKQLLENDSTENYFHQDEFGAISEIGFLSNLIWGFGYNMITIEELHYLTPSNSNAEIEISDIVLFMETVCEFESLQVNEFAYELEDDFHEVDADRDLLDCRLPECFFERHDDDIHRPIRYLREHQQNFEFSNYSLIHVQLPDGRTYQVFNLRNG